MRNYEERRAAERAPPKKVMPAKCIQEMCIIYPKLVNEYVARLPLRYGGPQCLISHHDLRTLLDKACDMAMGKFKDDRSLQSAAYERRACRAGQGAAEDAHGDDMYDITPVRRPMPEASQEEWWSRISKRQSALQSVKLGPEYKLRSQLALQHGDDLPQTPDPTKRTSKRVWEVSFVKWRKALHNWDPQGPPGLRQINSGRHGDAEDAYADWRNPIFEKNARGALENPIFEDGLHKGRDFKSVTERHPDFYLGLKHEHSPFLYFWEKDYIEWFEARESDMMELVAAVKEKDSAQVPPRALLQSTPTISDAGLLS